VNPWLQLGSTFLVGLITASGALVGVRMNARSGDRATEQREVQGRREEWIKLFHEALGYVVDDSVRKRVVGMQLMTSLAESDLAGPDERRLMETFADRALAPLLKELDESGNPRAEKDDPGRFASSSEQADD
jgi:hypothetical protein